MKKIMLVSLMLAAVQGKAANSERVILSDSKTFTTEVSVATVRCTDIGYGARELKINLAGLDGWTLFDHTNSHVGEYGEPCMTAGRCSIRPGSSTGFSIDDLIKNNPGIEVVKVDREVKELRYEAKDSSNNDVCNRYLQENLSTTIRGIAFHHSRTGAEQTFAIEYCRK